MIKDYSLCAVLTEKCDLNCPHCYQLEKDASLTGDEVSSIVDNLSRGLNRLVITGGEVYEERGLLYSFIEKARKKFPRGNGTIRVETNATYFYDTDEDILKEADTLFELGADEMKISRDEFHVLGGADMNRLDRVIQLLNGSNHPLRIKYLSLDNAVAVGNAEYLDASQKQARKCMNTLNSGDHPYFFTDVKGDLYTCTWKITPPLGNLITTPLSELVTRLSIPIQQNLLVGNIEDVALERGMEKSTLKRMSKEEGECMVCKRLFQ